MYIKSGSIDMGKEIGDKRADDVGNRYGIGMEIEMESDQFYKALMFCLREDS